VIALKNKKLISFAIVILITSTFAILLLRQNTNKPQTGVTVQEITQREQGKPQKSSESRKAVEVVAQNLKIPWDLVLMDSEILITERPGTLLMLKGGQRIPISGVKAIGEGGLLGVALHPKFDQNRFIYLYLTSQTGTETTNEVDRYVLDTNTLKDRKIIISGIRGAANHDGGRIAFGPDAYLYITVGDAQNENSSQDTNSLNGKILRLKDDGSIPQDNPFGNAVYSYGHRNPQGLAWDDKGRLFATEHGRSGALSGMDELNLIEKGKNYGWPTIQGTQTKEDMVTPVINSGPATTWAPSGTLYYKDSIFFTGLRGESLYQYDTATGTLKAHFTKEFGRLRTVVLGPNDYFYLLTNNTDGRGNPKQGDDKLLKIDARVLF